MEVYRLEEKKAIEFIKSELEDEKKARDDYQSLTGLYGNLEIEILLNLIEKQSKEIEHQKEKRENQKKELAILNAKQIEFNKLVNTVNSYKGQFKRQQKEIEELKEDKYGLEEEVQIQAKNLMLCEDAIKETYTKIIDKIKAKIEDILNSENSEAIEKLIKWQSLLEKE